MPVTSTTVTPTFRNRIGSAQSDQHVITLGQQRAAPSSIENLRRLSQVQPPLPLGRLISALNLSSETNEQLVEIYADLCVEMEALRAAAPNAPHKIYAVATEVKDSIIRKAAESPASAAELAQLASLNGQEQLVREINKTQTSNTPFKPLNAAFRNTLNGDRPANAPARVLHVSLEYTKAKVGGVGAVAESLLAAQNRAGLTARITTPFYECYKTDPGFTEAEFVGFVEHEYTSSSLHSEDDSRIAKSAIYKIKTQDGAVTQYLIKPDPRYATIFDVETPKDIFKNIPHSSKWDRNFYLTSAAAAMAGSYEGKNGTKAFDILHIQSWSIGLAGRLIKEKYNPEREQQHLAPVGIVQHFHGDNFGYEGKKCGCNHTRIGLQPPSVQYPATAIDDSYQDMNVQRDAWLLGTDAWIQVSDYYAKLATQPTTNLHENSRNIQERGGLHSVFNGITFDNFDITSPGTYNELAIDPSSTGSETPFLDGKERTKAALFQANVIPHASKPIYMFVGRFADEKGIDVLPAMAEQAIREGGQVVIMGTPVSGRLPGSLKKLLRMQKKHPGSIRVYTDINDQRAVLGETGVSKGLLIRQAADFTLIPSKREPCGLVGLEALAAGSIVVSSKVEGLSDFLIDHPKENFNAFTYEHGPAKVRFTIGSFIRELFWRIPRNRHAKQAIRSAAAYHRQTCRAERERTARRIWDSSRAYDWNAPNGAVDKISAIYRKVINKEIRPLEESDLKRLITKTPRWKRMFNTIRRSIIRTLLRCHKR